MSQSQPATSQSYPTQPKSPVRGKYLGAIAVLVVLLIGASGAAAYYYNQRGVSVDRTADLNTQIANLNAHINSDNDQINTLNQRISQLQQTQQAQCTADFGYSSCSAEISSLQSKVSDLQSQKVMLQAQINDLNDTLNLKKMQVMAKSVTVNWASCGETGQPSCLPETNTASQRYIYPSGFSSVCSSTCYAGYLEINWTSTLSVTAFFIFYTMGGIRSSTTISGSTSSGGTGIPFPGQWSGTILGGFQNDACFYDNFSNLHCPGGSLTYSETYVY
jgi:cell division protein FtsL